MHFKTAILFTIMVIACPVDLAPSYADFKRYESPVNTLYETSDNNGKYSKDMNTPEGIYFYHAPKYEYKYGVEDLHSSDVKSLSRDGDVVKGEYYVMQADGKMGTVKYTSDYHKGFYAEDVYSGYAIQSAEEKRSEQ